MTNLPATKHFFVLDDDGADYLVVANSPEHAEQILRDAGIEFTAEGLPYDVAKSRNLLSWKEINIKRATELQVHLNEGSTGDLTPLVQCEIGAWFCSEW